MKTLKNKKKVNFQSIEDIVKKNIIKPNTNSFGRKRRLACSFIHKNYLKTYRSQGLIFKTKQKPELIYPFDLVILADTDDIKVQYYRIKNNLHFYYNHKLIPGFEQFVFKNIQSLIKKFTTLDKVWTEVNKFRVAGGHDVLLKSKFKLIQYNEVIFQKQVRITPVAVFGYKKNSRDMSRKLGLPHFRTAKDFYESL
ncbi:MAG: hypothetical protein HQ402_01200 [Parcubacteria group bacterium]|nr:hypothetical protein [Parcubacteria group bacterium]